jgi:hypothetical protein
MPNTASFTLPEGYRFEATTFENIGYDYGLSSTAPGSLLGPDSGLR